MFVIDYALRCYCIYGFMVYIFATKENGEEQRFVANGDFSNVVFSST